MMPRSPQFFTVPAGTPSRRCACGRQVYWIFTAAGKRMPVNCEVPQGYAPSAPRSEAPHDGHGISHFVDCPKATQFRKPKPAASSSSTTQP
jgi:hypothetical protein